MKGLLGFLWFPAAGLTFLAACLLLGDYLGWQLPRLPWLGGPIALAGTLLALWCLVLFLHIGHGTPHPFTAKTRKLVTIGPYRWVRNPMMWGVGMILVGLALWFGKGGLWLAFGGFFLFLCWFVPNYEEPDMERRFGEEYREYCRRVPRGWPALRWR